MKGGMGSRRGRGGSHDDATLLSGCGREDAVFRSGYVGASGHRSWGPASPPPEKKRKKTEHVHVAGAY